MVDHRADIYSTRVDIGLEGVEAPTRSVLGLDLRMACWQRHSARRFTASPTVLAFADQ